MAIGSKDTDLHPSFEIDCRAPDIIKKFGYAFVWSRPFFQIQFLLFYSICTKGT